MTKQPNKFFCRFETRRKCLAPLGEPVRNAEPVVRFLQQSVFNDPGQLWRETCVALYLDSAQRIVGYEVISVGGVHNCTFDVLPVCRTAVSVMTPNVVIAHNHPNNICKPSTADVQSTERLRKALSLLEINLLDSIILTEKEAYSFAEERTLSR